MTVTIEQTDFNEISVSVNATDVSVQQAQNITLQLTPTATTTITLDRGVSGVGIVSVSIVYISPYYYFDFIYTDGTTQLVQLPALSSGVTSFNTRIGVVTLLSSDVTTALGYTPPTPTGTGASGTWPIAITGNAAGLSSTLVATNGGTGQSTVTTGDLLIGNTNAWAKLGIGSTGQILKVSGGLPVWGTDYTGTVTSVSVVSANGLAGTVATSTTTPAITLSTTITGLLKGNGTAISAATSGTDYAPATSGSSILYGNSGGFSNVSIGSGITFSAGTLSATGTGGTVTSVGLSLPSIFTVSSSPVTGSGTLTGSLNTQTANYVFAGPTTGVATAPTFRALVSADIPNNAANTTGYASNIAGGLAGSIPYQTAVNATSLLGIGTTGQILRVVSGLPAWGTDYVGTVTSVSGTGTVNGITLTGTVTSSGSLTLGGTLGSIANSQLTNSTISGVALGSNLNALTIGTGLSGTSYNGSSAVTVAIANSGVTAGTYGSAAVIPVIAVNSQGQITSISTQATNAPAYQGVWNASTNTPTLTSSVGTAGYYYVVSVAGNTTLNGATGWNVGDWAIFENSVWQKIPGSSSESFTNLTTTNLAVTGLTGYMYGNGASNVTASTTIPTTSLSGTITNAQLANSTISGVSLGSNLNSLTIGTGLTGTTYNGSAAVTITNSLPMVYPGTGIPNSTGSAWGTSYGVSGSGSVALTTSPTFVTPILGTPTSGTLSNCSGLPLQSQSTKTSAYTVTSTDDVILADTTSAAFSITLPTAVGIGGKVYTIKKINSGANIATVATTTSQTIDGQTSYSLSAQYSGVSVISNGANWFIICMITARNGTAGTF